MINVQNVSASSQPSDPQLIRELQTAVSEIASRASTATPGPWSPAPTNVGYIVYGEQYAITHNPTLQDAEFIAASRINMVRLNGAAAEILHLCEMALAQNEKAVEIDDLLTALSQILD